MLDPEMKKISTKIKWRIAIFLSWLRPDYCWGTLACWAMGYEFATFEQIKKQHCRTDFPDGSHAWCGKCIGWKEKREGEKP